MATLRVHVVPNAKIDSIVGEHGGAVKIKLRAPAVEQKANAALIRFLAGRLRLPRNAIVLERGHKSREKVIRINGLSEQDIRCRLGALSMEGRAPATPHPIARTRARGDRPSILPSATRSSS